MQESAWTAPARVWGVARQESDARKLAEQRGWYVVEVIVDNDISAAGKKARPGFEKALTVIATGGSRRGYRLDARQA